MPQESFTNFIEKAEVPMVRLLQFSTNSKSDRRTRNEGVPEKITNWVVSEERFNCIQTVGYSIGIFAILLAFIIS